MRFKLTIATLLLIPIALLARTPTTSGGKVLLRSGDSESLWEYHKFGKDMPIQFRLEGGKRYKLIVRGLEEPDDKIEIRASLDGKFLKSYQFRKHLSSKTVNNADGKLVTVGYIIYFRIPNGIHELSLEADKTLIGRIFAEPGVLVSIAPVSFADEDFLIVDDEEYEYYFTSRNEPAVFRLVGPLRFTLFSRLSFFPEMSGKQIYTLHLEENGTTKAFELETEPSAVSSYLYNEDITPGIASKTDYEIGPGAHEIRVWGENVAVKLYVPQSRLNNR